MLLLLEVCGRRFFLAVEDGGLARLLGRHIGGHGELGCKRWKRRVTWMENAKGVFNVAAQTRLLHGVKLHPRNLISEAVAGLL